MLKRLLLIALPLTLCTALSSKAQKNWNDIDLTNTTSVDTIKEGKYSLIFIDKSPDLNPEVKSRLITTFFTVYPKEAKKYNKKTTRKVIFFFDPEYDGVAAAGGGIIRFNPEWFRKNPNDIDVVTHEVMHLVQSYPGDAGPGWITEGIADYVRFTMGVSNAAANWKLPEYTSKQSYTDAYRVTARFFYWVEKKGNKGLVKKLDDVMRKGTYTNGFWMKETGKTIDELWKDYSESPALPK